MARDSVVTEGKGRRPRLSGATVKYIACATMLCDHTAVVFQPLLTTLAYEVMRDIGRVAFPLFCLMLAEGAVHTHDWRRYAMRLVAVGLVSEVPFDMVAGGSPLEWSHQNVMWTLLIGLLCVRLAMWMWSQEQLPSLVRGAAIIGITTAGGAMATLLRTDYDALGVLLIVVLWVLRSSPAARAAACTLVPALEPSELPGVLGSTVIAYLYDGTRGRQPHPLLFYAFYPVHLAVLALLGAMLLPLFT